MDATAKITRWLTGALCLVLRRRRAAWAAVLVLVGVMAFTALRVGTFSNDLGHMFPADSLSGNLYRLMTRSGLGDLIQLELASGQAGGAPAMLPAVDRLVAELSGMPSISSVDFRLAGGIADSWSELAPAWPLLTDASILATADPAQAVQKLRQALMLPAAPLAAWRHDPFGWQGRLLGELQDFHRLSGMKISLQHPYMTDADASRLLLTLQCRPGELATAAQIAPLLATIRQAVARELPGVTLTIISPLKHVLDNERAVRRDILQVSLLSLLALLILFLLLYRGAYDAVWIPLIPFATTVIVTGLMAVIFDEFCLFILGICGSIAGLAVDQGIHVYAAYSGRWRVRALARIWPPLLLSAATSALVFFMFALTGIRAYSQLGIFAGCALLVNVVLSFFILPTLLPQRPRLQFACASFQPGKKTAWLIVCAWLLGSAAAVSVLPRIRFDFNLSALDGASAETRLSEEEFQRRWRRDDAGNLIVVSANDRDELLQSCEALERLLGASGTRCFHPARLWPSRQTREAHRQTWRQPEATAALRRLEDELARECQRTGLPPAFFTAFFDSLRQGIAGDAERPEPAFFRDVTARLIRERGHTLSAMFFFAGALNDGELAALLEKLDGLGNCALLSNDAFRVATGRDFRPLASRVLLWVALGLLLLLLPVYRSPAKLLIIILPGFTAALWFAGLVAISGRPVNIATCFGMIMLIGLVIDYGIFALHHVTARDASTIPTAIFLSAGTTLLTSAALLVARHPILFHTGLVLFGQILLAALTALYVVPALVRLWRGRRGGLFVAALGLLWLAAGCRITSGQGEAPRQLTAAAAAGEWQAFQQAQGDEPAQMLTMKVDILWYSFPMLLVVQRDATSQRLQATGMLPTGAVVFAVSGEGGRQSQHHVAAVVPAIARKRIFAGIYDDLCNIFLTSSLPGPFPAVASTPIRQRLPSGVVQTLDGSPLRPVHKKLGTFPRRQWVVHYADWDDDLKSCRRIVYKNYRTRCTFTFQRPAPPEKETLAP
ncbi:MAG TPA: hypothetical protein PLE35_02475 [Lentisphaeria bacterium]|nr:hypothetical protein [Lentisphaeria bacterium]